MRRIAALVVAAALAAGCSQGSAGSDRSAPVCGARDLTGDTAPAAARQAALAYATAVAGHRYEQAELATEPCRRSQYASVRRLWKFMAGMPTHPVRVRAQLAKAAALQDGSARVRVTLYVRFGSPPHSAWITATTRTLLLDRRRGGWRVTADVTRTQHGKLSAYGFGSYKRPIALSGSRATVIYSAASIESEATTILKTADAVTGPLWRRYGGGRAAQRPVLFLVRNRRQAERLAHIQLGTARTPAGFQYSSYAYINLPQWEDYDGAAQRSMIVHELTHVASRAWVDKAPHSLAEGIAMYEEDRWRRAHHLERMLLLDMAPVYRAGFPSTIVWQRRETDWGLRNPLAVQACYVDAMLMVQQIVAHHGGVRALRRLGVAFQRRAGRRDFSAGDVDAAFRAALGVSFAEVVAEAHAAAGA
jgi:hypothetical protein